MKDLHYQEWKDLYTVEKPVRYVGGEWNLEKKQFDQVQVTVAMAFPDVYEVGMSHLGLKILYHLINSRPEYACERVFAPWPDREKKLRDQGRLLQTLESGRPLKDFQVLGFSLQHELLYTNVLNMLELGGVPWRNRDREGWPLVIAGGPGTYNPEPLADFVDCFFLGEGEEAILDFLRVVAEAGKNQDREEVLQEIVKLPGWYVPAFYELVKVNNFFCPEPGKDNIPRPVKKQVVSSLEESYYPHKIIVPFTEVIHDRISLEVSRGCTRGCRFCQAGMTYRPVRERSLETLQEMAGELLKNTGYDEISLLSLSSTDYSCIGELVDFLLSNFRGLGVGVALPSLRADNFSVEMARRVQQVRKTGLTFAPEAGTQRLRNVINKGVKEEDLLETVKTAFAAGWWSVKLYFMLGLPTEEDEDVKGIVELSHKVARAGKELAPRRPQITVNVSTFIPKAHTPFQWEAFIGREDVQRRQKILQEGLRGRIFRLSWHDYNMSLVEALLARGDRRAGKILEMVWQKGSRLDSWSEHFRPEKWLEAIQTSYSPELVYGPFPTEIPLPWSHLSAGVSRDYLLQERDRAFQGCITPDCRQGCQNCGLCGSLNVSMEIAGGD